MQNASSLPAYVLLVLSVRDEVIARRGSAKLRSKLPCVKGSSSSREDFVVFQMPQTTGMAKGG